MYSVAINLCKIAAWTCLFTGFAAHILSSGTSSFTPAMLNYTNIFAGFLLFIMSFLLARRYLLQHNPAAVIIGLSSLFAVVSAFVVYSMTTILCCYYDTGYSWQDVMIFDAVRTVAIIAGLTGLAGSLLIAWFGTAAIRSRILSSRH